MSYRISLPDVEAVCAAAQSMARQLAESGARISSAAMRAASTDAFAGAAAQACSSRVMECSYALGVTLATLAQELGCEAALYQAAWHELEPNGNAYLSDDSITEVAERALKGWGDFQGMASELEDTVWSVADIVEPPLPSTQGVLSAYSRCQTESEITRDRAADIETQGAARAAHVNGLLDALEAYVSRCEATMPKAGTVACQPGSLASLPEFERLRKAVGESLSRSASNAARLDDAAAAEEHVASYREAEAAGWRVATGTLASVYLGLGLVDVWGAAGAVGKISTAFAASDLAESLGDVWLGLNGDAHTRAFNPLRDTVFFGREKVYRVSELGFSLYAAGSSSGIPKRQRIDLPKDVRTGETHAQEAERIGLKKINGWEYSQDAYTYFSHKRTYDNNAFFNQTSEEILWPPNDGFVPGTRHRVFIREGTVLTRYGSANGRYYSPRRFSKTERALPPKLSDNTYREFIVKKGFYCEVGETSPWFDDPGGAIQFLANNSVDDLLLGGYLLEL